MVPVDNGSDNIRVVWLYLSPSIFLIALGENVGIGRYASKIFEFKTAFFPAGAEYIWC